MLSGCLGISYKVAALFFGAWLVQKVALTTGKTLYKPIISSRIDNVAPCPCNKRVKVKVCTEALWYNAASYICVSKRNAFVSKTNTVSSFLGYIVSTVRDLSLNTSLPHMSCWAVK
jgi:hypothetical protein